MSEAKKLGDLIPKAVEQMGKINSPSKKDRYFYFTESEFIALMMRTYYQGWDDHANDKHGNAGTFINSILK